MEKAKAAVESVKQETRVMVMSSLRQLSALDARLSKGSRASEVDAGNGDGGEEGESRDVGKLPNLIWAWRIVCFTRELGRKHVEVLATSVDELKELVDDDATKKLMREELQALLNISSADLATVAR